MADELIDETIFTWGAPPLKFGAGAADEIGFELAQYAVGRVLVVTDLRGCWNAPAAWAARSTP